MKTCSMCKATKPEEAFARDKNTNDGRNYRCRDCSSAVSREWRLANPGRTAAKVKAWNKANPDRARKLRRRAEAVRRQRYPERIYAKNRVYRAIRSGQLRRETCEVCGDPKAHAHHDDYSKPLEVRWLCGTHHRILHGATK